MLYAVVSLAGFVLIVWGYGLARQDPVALFAPPEWNRHLALLLMIPVSSAAAGHLPARTHPGKSAVGHPMLIAVKLWALAHLLANGNLGDVVLFGTFLAWAVADRISLKRRTAPWVETSVGVCARLARL